MAILPPEAAAVNPLAGLKPVEQITIQVLTRIGWGHVTDTQLAGYVGCARQTATRAVKALLEAGWLHWSLADGYRPSAVLASKMDVWACYPSKMDVDAPSKMDVSPAEPAAAPDCAQPVDNPDTPQPNAPNGLRPKWTTSKMDVSMHMVLRGGDLDPVKSPTRKEIPPLPPRRSDAPQTDTGRWLLREGCGTWHRWQHLRLADVQADVTRLRQQGKGWGMITAAWRAGALPQAASSGGWDQLLAMGIGRKGSDLSGLEGVACG